jgi:hypothetical protein
VRIEWRQEEEVVYGEPGLKGTLRIPPGYEDEDS